MYAASFWWNVGLLHVMQHEPLSEIEADAEVPLLPVDMIAIHGEARAFRLNDVQWLQTSPYPHFQSCQLLGEVGHQGRDFWHLYTILFWEDFFP